MVITGASKFVNLMLLVIMQKVQLRSNQILINLSSEFSILRMLSFTLMVCLKTEQHIHKEA